MEYRVGWYGQSKWRWSNRREWSAREKDESKNADKPSAGLVTSSKRIRTNYISMVFEKVWSNSILKIPIISVHSHSTPTSTCRNYYTTLSPSPPHKKLPAISLTSLGVDSVNRSTAYCV